MHKLAGVDGVFWNKAEGSDQPDSQEVTFENMPFISLLALAGLAEAESAAEGSGAALRAENSSST